MASNLTRPMDRLLKTCVDPQTLGMLMQRLIKEELEFLDTRGSKEDQIARLVADNERNKSDDNLQSDDTEGDGPWDQNNDRAESQEEENEDPERPVVFHIPQPVAGQPTEVYMAQLVGSLSAMIQQNQRLQLDLQKNVFKQLNTKNETRDIQIHTTPDLYNSIPEFYGRRTDSAKNWLQIVSRIAEQQNWKSQTKLSMVASRLRGEALDWQETSGWKIGDWENWVDIFLTHFSKPMTIREWTKLVESRTQTQTEPLSVYIRSKLKIINQSPIDIPTCDKIDYLISGMRDRTTAHIFKLQHFSDVYEILEAAREIDEQIDLESKFEKTVRRENPEKNWFQQRPSRDGNFQTSVERPKQPSFNRTVTTGRYPISNRASREINPLTVYRKGMDKRNITCFNCNTLGHLSFECDKPAKIRTSNLDSRENPKKVNCLLRSEEQNLPVVKGVIGGKIVQILLDSGSEVSLIDKRLVPQTAIVNTWDGESELLILGSSFRPLGTVNLNVEVGNTQATIPFCVADNAPYDALLGGNWRKAVNIVMTVYPNSDVEIQKHPTQNFTNFDNVPLKRPMIGCILKVDVKKNQDHSKNTDKTNKDIPEELVLQIDDTVKNCDSHISTENKERLRNILINHAGAFTTNGNTLGKCPHVKHAIHLKDDIPVKSSPYRYSWKDRQFINDTVAQWKKMGIAEDSTSEYSSPIVLVDQPFHPTTPRRLCIDYRQLNSKSVKIQYPMPIMEDVIERMTADEAAIFTTMDIKTAFMTVEMKEDDKYKTAFITQDGLFQFRRMPFGLSGGPATMQSVMNHAYRGIPNTATFIDDIGQGSKTVETALDLLEQTLDRTIENGLLVTLEKCQLLKSEVKFLGNVINRVGYKPDPDRTAAVDRFKTFENVKHVRSFVQFASHYRKFVKDFARIARPLNNLLKKESKFVWTDEHDEAVSTLKELLKSSQILGHFKRQCETAVYVDASLNGLGAVLTQTQGGREVVIEFASKSLSDGDKKLHSNALECLAVHWAISEKFRIYLYGAPKFTIWTDNWSASYLMIQSKVNRRFARWMLDLQEFDYVIRHHSGKKNAAADALSRQHVCMAKVVAVDSRLKIEQESDVDCREIIRILKEDLHQDSEDLSKIQKCYDFVDGFLVHKPGVNEKAHRSLVVPRSLQHSVLQLCHDDGGHMDADKTTSKIRSKFWWKSLTQDVRNYVRSCRVCQEMNYKPASPDGLLFPRPVPDEPYDTISVDHFGPLERVNEYTHVLISIDHATRHIIAKPVESTSAACYIEFLKNNIINVGGTPSKIVSDGASSFTSHESVNFLNSQGIEPIYTPPYWPRSNGLIERSVGTVKSVLRKALQGKPNWPDFVQPATMAVNSCIHSSTNFSPFFLLHGYEPKLPKQMQIGVLYEEMKREEQLSFLTDSRKLAKQRLLDKNLKMKTRHDKSHHPANYSVGDLVMYHLGKRSNSMSQLFDGPYTISEIIGDNIYKLKLIDSDSEQNQTKIAHAHQLKRFWKRSEDPLARPEPDLAEKDQEIEPDGDLVSFDDREHPSRLLDSRRPIRTRTKKTPSRFKDYELDVDNLFN